MVLAGTFTTFLLFLVLGLAALAVTAALDKAIGKERALLAWAVVLLGITFLLRPAVPAVATPKTKALEFGKNVQNPTTIAAPTGDPLARDVLARSERNAFMPLSDTSPLPPEKLPEPPGVGLPFPLPPTVPGPGLASRRLLRGALPTTKVGDGSKLVDVPADVLTRYNPKPEDVFDWVMLGGTRYYVYILDIDGQKEGSKAFEEPRGLKWNLALQEEPPIFPKPWKQLKVKFAAVGGEEEAKGKLGQVKKSIRERIQVVTAEEREHWYLRRSVANLFVESCRRQGNADPAQLGVEQLKLVAAEMAQEGAKGKEDGAGWRRAIEVLELALEKTKQSAIGNATDVLLPLIEAYRAVHDERAVLSALKQYTDASRAATAVAEGSAWLGEAFLDGLGLPDAAGAFYGKALELQPANRTALVGRGDAWTLAGDHGRALKAYRDAAQAGARVEVAVREAEALLRTGAVGEARQAVDAALSASAFDPRALVTKGAVLYAAGDVQAARDAFAQASALPGEGSAGVEARRHRAEALWGLGLAEWRLGHGDAAHGAFDKCDEALRTGSQRRRTADETIVPELGRALLQLSAGNLDAAGDALERAREQAPGVAYVEVLAGWLAWKQGDAARARTRFENALALAPDLHELDAWIAETRLALAQAAVQQGVSPAETKANFEAAVLFAERAAAVELAADPRSTDFAVREALTRLGSLEQIEKKRFEAALKTAQGVLDRIREERRCLAIKGYCNYRLGAFEPEKYDECLRNFQQLVDVNAPADDPLKLYAQDCLKRVKHWQSLEEKVVAFESKLGNDWQTSESSGVRIFVDQGSLHLVDASPRGATVDGGPTDPTVFARNEKLFDKASLEKLDVQVSIPSANQKNNVTVGIAIQPPGGKNGMKTQGLAVLWDKGKVAARIGGAVEAEWKDGEVHRVKNEAGAEMDWPDASGGPVRITFERVNPADGTFAVRLNDKEILRQRVPAFKEGRGPLEFWVGGWSNQAANWDLRVDDLRIVRKK
jgi:predicted Zn-dependent protease